MLWSAVDPTLPSPPPCCGPLTAPGAGFQREFSSTKEPNPAAAAAAATGGGARRWFGGKSKAKQKQQPLSRDLFGAGSSGGAAAAEGERSRVRRAGRRSSLPSIATPTKSRGGDEEEDPVLTRARAGISHKEPCCGFLK